MGVGLLVLKTSCPWTLHSDGCICDVSYSALSMLLTSSLCTFSSRSQNASKRWLWCQDFLEIVTFFFLIRGIFRSVAFHSPSVPVRKSRWGCAPCHFLPFPRRWDSPAACRVCALCSTAPSAARCCWSAAELCRASLPASVRSQQNNFILDAQKFRIETFLYQIFYRFHMESV